MKLTTVLTIEGLGGYVALAFAVGCFVAAIALVLWMGGRE